MRRVLPGVAAGLILLVRVAGVGAQVLELPARAILGAGAGPTRQELTLNGSLLGGYDSSTAPPVNGGTSLTPRSSGSTGYGETALRYSIARNTRLIEVGGRAYLNTSQDAVQAFSYGGDQTARVHLAVGRRNQLDINEAIRNDPYFSMRAFDPLAANNGAYSPDANVANGLAESRSVTTNLSASLGRQWGRRTTTNAAYSFNAQRYSDGAGFDSRAGVAAFSVNRTLGRTLSVQGSYQRAGGVYTQQDGSVRLNVNHTADAGLQYQLNLSRTRRLSLGGGGGVHNVQTTDFTGAALRFWTPSAYGTARLDLGRTWNVGVNYTRAVMVFQGVTPESFVTHTGTLTVGGLLGPRFDTVLTAGYSNGETGRSPAGAVQHAVSYTGSAQLRIRVTRALSSVVSVNHYQYRLNDIASQAIGIAPRTERDSIRLGLSWTLPLYAMPRVAAPRN